MSYEALTVSDNLRAKVLNRLEAEIPEIKSEKYFSVLKNFRGKIGLKEGDSEATRELDKYFDSLLPKTAGGLWHELLVYVFLQRLIQSILEHQIDVLYANGGSRSVI
ncbi:hypothetical protein IBX73_10265 [candidate division WOR-3 bacterium]|nr:hypothetical protein [candidate division WOR-3 bacterium]